MNRPGLWIIVGLLLAAAGLAVFWGSLLGAHYPDWHTALRALRATQGLGLAFSIFGLILAAIAFAVHRKRAALLRGDGLVARWRVGTLEWDAFRRHDTARSGLIHSLRNRLRLPARLPPEGMEIRIGRDALLAGEACYGLGYFASRGKLVDIALLDGQPAMLEFTTYQYSKGNSRLAVFRLPTGGRAEAQAVLDHFQRTLDPRRRAGVRQHFAAHYHAASGDPGKAAAARAADRSATLRLFGFVCLLLGAAMLGILFSTERGPHTDPGTLRILTFGSWFFLLAGLGGVALSMLLGRRR